MSKTKRGQARAGGGRGGRGERPVGTAYGAAGWGGGEGKRCDREGERQRERRGM